MNKCTHLGVLDFLRLQKPLSTPHAWQCQECGTAENNRLCLTCGHVGCSDKHSQLHNEAHSHPLCLEIGTQLCHCYGCDSRVTQDNGDLAMICEILTEVKAHCSQASRTRRGTIINQAQLRFVRGMVDSGMFYTASAFRRRQLLRASFAAWRAKLAKKNQKQFQSPIVVKGKRRRPTEIASPTDLIAAYNAGLTKKCMKRKEEQEELVVAGYVGMRQTNEWSGGRTGLRNLGNSCYVNAVVQALRSVHVFNQFFLQSPPPPPSSTSNSSTMQTPEAFDLEGNVSLTEEVSNLFRIIESGRWAAVSPYKLILAIWRLVPSFRSYKQQDAQEFFSFFLDQLELELAERSGGFKSFIKDTFESHVLSQTTCDKCGTVSDYKHPGSKYVLLDLSSTLSKMRNQKEGDSRRAKTTCSIIDCLADLTSPVSLAGNSKYQCQSCKSLQNATKRDVIVAVPRVLVFFVNRTHWGDRGKCKLDTFVDFPTVGLDMSPYCMPHKNVGTLLYNLSAMVLHHGSNVDQGHYTAQCFNAATDSWLHFNDLKVLMTDSDRVKKLKGYLLFYERAEAKSTPVT